MSKTIKLTSASIEGLYTYRVKPLLNRAGFNYYDITDKKKNSGVSDVYFFNEMYSGWAALKLGEGFIPAPGRIFKPAWKRGEIVFLRKLADAGIRSVIIMELATGVFYSEKIEKGYLYKDLIPFTLKKFFL
jgi:hypothetical protein